MKNRLNELFVKVISFLLILKRFNQHCLVRFLFFIDCLCICIETHDFDNDCLQVLVHIDHFLSSLKSMGFYVYKKHCLCPLLY